MKDLETLIEERARKGKLNSLSLIASSHSGPARPGAKALFKAHCRTPEGVLSTGEDEDPVKALVIALRGDNAGINRTKKRSADRPNAESPPEEDFNFG